MKKPGKFLFALLFVGSQSSFAVPDVAVTIKPIHSLVSYIMQDVAEPYLVLDGYVSPHTFQLRPSQARKLNNADLIFWVGPRVETFFRKIQSNFSDDKIVTLDNVTGVRLLAARSGGVWGVHDHDDHDDHDDHSDHDGSRDGYDGHIWLDPTNAIVMSRAIVEHLGALDQPSLPKYRSRLLELEILLENLDQNLKHSFSGIADKQFVVLHDAYQYFELRYGLEAIGSLNITAGEMASAKRLDLIQDRIRQTATRCLVVEPQVRSSLAKMFQSDMRMSLVVLDPIGTMIPAGSNHYSMMMLRNSQALISCLREP